MPGAKKKSKVLSGVRKNESREVRHLDSSDEEMSDHNEEEEYYQADPYEDEYEDEDVVYDDGEEEEEVEVEGEEALRQKLEELNLKAQSRENKLIEEEEEAEKERLGINSKAEVYKPGEDFDTREYEMTFQNRAYEVHYRIRNEWPALSFDILSQPLDSTNYPLSCYFVAGVQTDNSITEKNCYLIKAYDMYKTRYDSDESDVEDEEDEETMDDEPSLEYQMIPISANVNRVRAMPQNRNIVGFWCEDAKVHIYDLTQMSSVLRQENMANSLKSINKSKKPIQTFDFHRTEGFAMDWSKCVEGRIATGDCNGEINVMDIEGSGIYSWKRIYNKPFTGHSSSVEDIQFSPNEDTVFASCSCDRTIKFWDTRRKNRKHGLSFQASEDADVNVISWNPLTTYLIASGDDNGQIRIWDMRQCSDQETALKPVGQFSYHHTAISSIEWNPHDSTILAASDSKQVTIWDLSLERDAEQEQIEKEIGEEYPPQLLFEHLGQNEVKEVHWHPRIKNMLLTTSLDGYSLFIPENLSEEALMMDHNSEMADQ
ncbi:hypothetical protein FDP41_012363 [Naegleria fowleri]|uniref:Uncharacterized protein n=1 Tax=Naegleria fowleri TaxID=5763 RepID=A0A6A5C206_NAEFO|nr:uncharacterized protein FDP41_012363 [Naegleria fowleri]KAF0981706.1 hypothetical protein FDP41_012363 [Naegleria fowleri]CAG4712077.1 unnamed protein product [Naegleria fowleri]